MSSFRNLNFNNGQGVTLGYITKFWGLSGYSPIETVHPTGLNVNKYKKTVQDRYSSEVPGAISILNGIYNTFDEANTALSEVADVLTNNVYWLYGSLEKGGCFWWSAPGSNDLHFVNFYGLYYIEDLIQGNKYQYFAGTTTVPFRCNINNDQTLPLVDNTLFFFNANNTEENGPVNHVFDSEHEIRIVDCQSLTRYIGDDYEWQSIWNQSQWFELSTSVGDWSIHYLYEYTTENLSISNPHPWKRWKQNRVVPNIQWFVGIDVPNGELIGGYVPIENSDAVTYSDDDPNGDSGGPAGGDGDKNALGEDIDTGSVPSSSFLQTGISRIFLPTQQQMTDFCDFVFSDITQSAVDQLKKMWSNPLDYVENLGVCRLHGITSTGTINISFGGVDSGVPCNYTNSAFLQFDYKLSEKFGEYWGNALDYSNYTKIKIYIPYCGLYDLNVDEFMVNIKNYGGCDIVLRYRVDLMSGMCVAFVKPVRAQYGSDNFSNMNSFLYQYNGNIYLPLSLTATDWRNTYQSVLGIAGGMIAPSPATAVGMAEGIMGQKVSVQHSGSIGTNFGYMGIQKPFLIVERPAISEPKLNASYSYETNYGYPSNKLVQLDSATGFVKVRKGSFWGMNLHATDGERKEIIDLLENEGVYLT